MFTLHPPNTEWLSHPNRIQSIQSGLFTHRLINFCFIILINKLRNTAMLQNFRGQMHYKFTNSSISFIDWLSYQPLRNVYIVFIIDALLINDRLSLFVKHNRVPFGAQMVLQNILDYKKN